MYCDWSHLCLILLKLFFFAAVRCSSFNGAVHAAGQQMVPELEERAEAKLSEQSAPLYRKEVSEVT